MEHRLLQPNYNVHISILTKEIALSILPADKRLNNGTIRGCILYNLLLAVKLC